MQRHKLAVEICQADGIVVDQRDCADAGSGQRFGRKAAHAADADEMHRQAELAGDGDVTKTVPIDYIFSTKGDFEVASFRILKVEGRKGVPEDYYSDHFSIVAQYSYKVGA